MKVQCEWKDENVFKIIGPQTQLSTPIQTLSLEHFDGLVKSTIAFIMLENWVTQPGHFATFSSIQKLLTDKELTSIKKALFWKGTMIQKAKY